MQNNEEDRHEMPPSPPVPSGDSGEGHEPEDDHELEHELEEEQPKGISGALRKLATSFQARPAASTRKQKTQDRSRTFVGLSLGVLLLALAFLFVFSSPERLVRRDSRKPNLGRPQNSDSTTKSVVPINNAEGHSNGGDDTVSEDDISGMSHRPKAPPPAPTPAIKDGGDKYALNRIHFDAAPPPAAAPPQAVPKPSLAKSSLVFIRTSDSPAPITSAIARQEAAPLEILPPGSRLIARLETPVSSAIQSPVIAAIEYNYIKDGAVVIPAGSRAFGKLASANENGFVGIRFYRIQFPDETTVPIEANAMDLDFKPIKGVVTGKNSGKKFLVRAVTGVGTMAAQFAGTGNSLNAPISQETLLRERLAQNVAMAGEQQFNDLAYRSNIVVTVPGKTRIYIVLSGDEDRRRQSPESNTAASNQATGPMPAALELQELMQLKQELQKYSPQQQTAPGANAPTSPQSTDSPAPPPR
ncbi:MAG: TrbI/VirB10 family protein [Bryobacteraceae bacterium]